MENKYSNTLKRSGRFILGVLTIILALALLICPFFITGFAIYAVDILLVTMMLLGYLIFLGILLTFTNQSFDWQEDVQDDNTSNYLVPDRTPKYRHRLAWFYFIEFIAYILLACVYFILSAAGYLNPLFIILGIIAVVVTILCFLLAGKNYIDWKNNTTSNGDKK